MFDLILRGGLTLDGIDVSRQQVGDRLAAGRLRSACAEVSADCGRRDAPGRRHRQLRSRSE